MAVLNDKGTRGKAAELVLSYGDFIYQVSSLGSFTRQEYGGTAVNC